jgi:hypothetical protein
MNTNQPTRIWAGDLKARANRAGSYFFSPNTLKAWGTRLHRWAYEVSEGGGGWFMTSDNGPHGSRVWTVREWQECCDDWRVTETHTFTNPAQARRMLTLLADGYGWHDAKALAVTGYRRTDLAAAYVFTALIK